eukprot:TRINITY_DN135_c0_g1_i2.p2 TRINITY_DN135_c0_g1~~TRINITY_DN135_c0_g1_i2.p2  ORF type:complete len:191 (-),score=47.03 TRINITY_DN135_c0_g1_i2:70-606(-)
MPDVKVYIADLEAKAQRRVERHLPRMRRCSSKPELKKEAKDLFDEIIQDAEKTFDDILDGADIPSPPPADGRRPPAGATPRAAPSPTPPAAPAPAPGPAGVHPRSAFAVAGAVAGGIAGLAITIGRFICDMIKGLLDLLWDLLCAVWSGLKTMADAVSTAVTWVGSQFMEGVWWALGY